MAAIIALRGSRREPRKAGPANPRALQRRGLMHVYTGAANVEDVPDIRIERQLIGIALDHREMHANPATIVRRLAQI